MCKLGAWITEPLFFMVLIMLFFRKISSLSQFDSLVSFLKEDVILHGGSASEIVDMHGTLRLIMICTVPWGTLLLNQEIDYLQALLWIHQSE